MFEQFGIKSPKKSHLHIDFDYGRPAVQQVSYGNDLPCLELLTSSNTPTYTSSSNESVVPECLNNIFGNSYNPKFNLKNSCKSTNMFQREYQSKAYYSNSPLSIFMTNEEMINLGVINKEVHLEMKTPPEHRFRYRYDTEMSGTHGSLQGIRSGSEKSAPEVELVNYPHEAYIRVSLVTCNEVGERYPHPHNLFIKEKMYQKKIYENLHNKPLTKTGHYSDPHYIRVGMNRVDYVARFEGMCIISSKKENFSASIKEKLEIRDLEQGVRLVKREDILKKVDEAVKLVDLDSVCLCFEAFRKEGVRLVQICPPLYSDPIGNAKSANTGKLKISRINKCSGNCQGGDEIWMLVEKINKKGLIIRFFEECDGKLVWESCIKGDDITLHHQYAIIFKTPPYRDPNINTEVKVFLRLERSLQLPQASDFSEPITFVYEPIRNKNHRNDNIYRKESILCCNKQTHVKRPRAESSVVPTVDFQYKRKKDEQECSNACFDDADLDHILSDNNFDSNHLGHCPGFNLEDFLQFIDEQDMTLLRDGVTSDFRSRWDLMQLLRRICAKCDENEVKKLTERINDLKFSKGRSKIESETEDEKKDVEDAVSTLLSLRERTVDINRLKMENDKDECNTLHQAVLQNRPDILRQLLKSSNFSDMDENDNTPLHLSLILKHNSCTESLLEYRQEISNTVNLKNKEGKTPLHLAAANGSLRHVKLILESGADVNDTETKTKRNALHIAVVEKNLDLVEYLVQNTDVRLDAEDSEGLTPLDIAQILMPPVKTQFENLIKLRDKKKPKIGSARSLENGEEENLDKLYEILNETGSWRILAEMWNCSYLIPTAEKAENPSKCIFSGTEKENGEIELESLRNLLDVINEKKGLIVLDEILARKFLYGK